MPCDAWICGECKLGDKCRFEHDPKSAPKCGGADERGKGIKCKGKSGKETQPGGGHVQKCFKFLKGKCEKGKDCGFTHSKADPSKGDLEDLEEDSRKAGQRVFWKGCGGWCCSWR